MATEVLTDKLLSKLRRDPDEQGQEIIDGGFGCKGGSFVCRVCGGGSITFNLRYRVKGGQQRRYYIGSYPPLTLSDARKAARTVLARVQLGEDPQLERRTAQRSATFGALFEHFMQEEGSKKRSADRMREQAERDLLPRWKTRKADGITDEDVQAVLNAIVGRGAPVAANRVRSLILTVFKFGVKCKYVKENPCKDVAKPSAETSRDRVLAPAELKAMWKQFDKSDLLTGTAFKLMLLTAARHNEVLSMRWEELDLPGAAWVIPAERAKNGCQHTLPLSRQAVGLLEGLRPVSGSSPFVFPAAKSDGPMGYLHKAWDDMTEAADLTKLAPGSPKPRPHDLRRTAATLLGESRCSTDVLKRILNHGGSKSVQDVTDIYNRAKLLQPARAALQRLADSIDRILKTPDNEEANIVPFKEQQA